MAYNIEKYKDIIYESGVLFIPLTCTGKWSKLSNDPFIIDVREMRRYYPGHSYITRKFEADNVSGYLLVSKRRLREKVPGLLRASSKEVAAEANRMMDKLIKQLKLKLWQKVS